MARRRGFTLIEVMAVLVIIGLLATVAGLNVRKQMIDARRERVGVDMSTIVNAAEMHRVKRGRLPRDMDELWAEGDGELRAEPIDPWGYRYELEVRGSKVDVLCLGADGAPGGEGEDADLRASVLLAPKRR